ncbi:hypothetical protein VUR80DRAFT_8196 [Thermomyces stellatus]
MAVGLPTNLGNHQPRSDNSYPADVPGAAAESAANPSAAANGDGHVMAPAAAVVPERLPGWLRAGDSGPKGKYNLRQSRDGSDLAINPSASCKPTSCTSSVAQSAVSISTAGKLRGWDGPVLTIFHRLSTFASVPVDTLYTLLSLVNFHSPPTTIDPGDVAQTSGPSLPPGWRGSTTRA